MGAGIAQLACQAGARAVLWDPDPDALSSGVERVRTGLEKAASRGVIPDAAGPFGRLEAAETSSELAPCELVIEAAPEVPELKARLFEELSGIVAEDCVLATNTSSLPVTGVAASATHPERVVGMHFFNPVPKMKLVEIVRALDISEDAIAVTTSVARRMGKETVLVRESPGFITSRINAMIGNEAFLMLQEGVATAEDIDKALKLGLNHSMGPFELGDLVGLDTRLSILEYLHRSLGEKYRPCPLLAQYVKAGRLGRKVGRGVYDY